MAGEAPGPSAQRIHQQQPTLFMPYVNNNVSVRTGEEFSLMFLQDRVAARRVPAVANSGQKREKRAVFNYDQNGQLGFEDLTGILGLRRIDSESTSDMSMPEHASARTSFNAKEMENGAYVDKSSKYYKENGDSGHRSRKAFGELNFDRTGMGIPIPPPLHKSGSPHSNNYPGSGVSGGSQLGRMKFLCSFGGKILPRPSDGKLRYVGGDTHIISIRKRITREELMKKTLGICNQPHTIKYQLPDEDLDALISVSSDEDLQNMIEEYCGLERHGGSQRLRIFLIPLCESEILSSFDGNTIQQNNPDYQYVVAVNGILDHTPRKNTSGMSLASEANKLGANLDCIPSFHRSSRTAPVPLELKGGFNALHPAQFFNQSQNMSRSPNHSPSHSPVPLQQEDSKSVHMQLHGDNSHKSSNEISSSSFTTQLPPEGSSTNTAGSKYLPQGEVTLMNHHHPNKQVDVSQPEHPHGEHIHNRNSRNETTSSVDRNDSDFDGFSYEKPKHKERTFHSEKPTSRPQDPLGLFSGSSDCIDSHRRMSHAFSDSKLNENGGSSAYCSQEGMSPLSPLNFPKAQPPLHLSASQEKPLQRNENMGLVYPQVQYMLVDVDPTGSQSRLDLLNSSSCSEIPSWNKPIYKVTGGVDDKYPTPGKDFSKSAFITLNHLEKNSSTLETMERLDEKYPFLYQGGKIYEERSPATGLECKNILPNVKSNLTSSFGVDTSTQELQVSGNVLPASSAIYFKPFVDNIIEHPKNFQVEKTPPDLGMSQRTANNQDCDLTTRVIGEQEKYISGFGNSEVAGLCPSARQQSYDLSDLMAGSIYGLASHAPPLFQPVGSQKDMAVNEPKLMSSIDLYPSAVHDDSDLSSNLNKNDHTLIGNPTEDALFLREFSLLDADFVSYPYQKVENLGYGGSVCEKSNVKDSTSENLNFPIKSHEKNQLESVIGEDVNETIHSHVQSLSITVPYILDETSSYKIDFRSPAATEVEGSVIPEFESEDAKADDEDITYSISGAMIAEMEASIYGLQEKGTVTLEYKISNTGGDVCHGTLSRDVVSFIRYDTIEKAQMSQSLLQRLRTAEFVNPLMVISSKPNVWLVVPKIDSTLDQFKKKNTRIWSCDDLLDDKYKIVVRDIIAGVIQLVNQGYMGELKIQDIAIINGHAKLMRISNELAVSKLRDVIQLVNQGYMGELKIQDIAIINGCAKLMRISNELGVSKLRDQLQNLLEDLLGNDPNNKELINFYSHLKSMQMCKLIHLRNHPILLTSQERLQIPVLLPLLLKYEKKSSNWKRKYDRQYRDEEVKKAKRLEKDQEYKVVYEYKSDQKREVNYIARKVEKDQDYKNVYKYRIYPNTASSQIDLSRNIIVHINDDGQCRTNEEVGKKLKYFFPDLWTRLFSLMISEGIDI